MPEVTRIQLAGADGVNGVTTPRKNNAAAKIKDSPKPIKTSLFIVSELTPHVLKSCGLTINIRTTPVQILDGVALFRQSRTAVSEGQRPSSRVQINDASPGVGR